MPTQKLPMPLIPDFTFDGGWADVQGAAHVAFTNLGQPFRVWVPAGGNNPDDCYFCHGHSFDTYRLFGYSPFSGPNLNKLLGDEYVPVAGGLGGLNAGDVVVWRQGGNAIHSCLVVNAPLQRTLSGVSVWSKNGRLPVVLTSLQQVINTYPPSNLEYWHPQ